GRALRGRFEYQKDVTRYDSTTEDFLKLGQGVCQDFAHLMLGWLRLSGIPCRYVSGYLHVDRRKREPSQSHAWVEFHAPSAGWVAFDPTHGRSVDERYVVVGHGRHYDDVPPNKGIYRGTARETLAAEVYTRLVTGTAIDRRLRAGERSALHRIKSDEVWHHYAGDAVELWLREEPGRARQVRLGGDGEPQVIVPAGVWYGARVVAGGAYALMGGTVAPGFDFADFELADRAALLAKFPGQRAVIEALT